jgi:cyclopropane fatty-acyl-phospholipid synthase-like methyltransferase
MEIFKEDKDLGYLGNHPMWWFDPSVAHSYSIFKLDDLYPGKYFQKDHVTAEIAEEIVGNVLKFGEQYLGRPVGSVLEIGCGGGWFTKVFLERGLRVVAIEGSLAGRKKALKNGVPPSVVRQIDLRWPLDEEDVEGWFDIVMCTEVAEHIEPPFAGTLVYNLTKFSDLVWFSSEEPSTNEDHYHHSNEQPEIFWKNLFEFHGFRMDLLPIEEFSLEAKDRGKQMFVRESRFS